MHCIGGSQHPSNKSSPQNIFPRWAPFWWNFGAYFSQLEGIHRQNHYCCRNQIHSHCHCHWWIHRNPGRHYHHAHWGLPQTGHHPGYQNPSFAQRFHRGYSQRRRHGRFPQNILTIPFGTCPSYRVVQFNTTTHGNLFQRILKTVC